MFRFRLILWWDPLVGQIIFQFFFSFFPLEMYEGQVKDVLGTSQKHTCPKYISSVSACVCMCAHACSPSSPSPQFILCLPLYHEEDALTCTYLCELQHLDSVVMLLVGFSQWEAQVGDQKVGDQKVGGESVGVFISCCPLSLAKVLTTVDVFWALMDSSLPWLQLSLPFWPKGSNSCLALLASPCLWTVPVSNSS